ncbi:NAD(P)H-quinone oxidoreductase chain, partial [Trifolium medium]|nr:NAD(P)H-quinone oxidoreductase chain [Trifolium medium]
GPVTSNSPHKQATATTNANAKPNPPMNHGAASRQKPMKRGGGNSSSNEPAPFPNSFSNPPYVNLQPSAAPPPYPVVQIPSNTAFADGVQSYRNNNGWSPRSPVAPVGGYGLPVDEHRNPSRRGNYGNRPHNNSGIRRNHDPGNIVNTRDAHGHQHRMHSGGFVRPTLHNSPSYLGSPSMRPFVNTFGFHEFYYYPTLQFEQFGGMPFLTHPPPPAMFFPVPETLETPAETTSAETPLTSLILKQIEYYFSDVNLANDDFLKFNMDEQGWVPITLIANFPRVKKLTNNIELILDSLRTSKVVEVHGDKMRRRNELMRCLPSAHQHQLASSGSVSSSGSSCNNIVADFDKITLDEATGHKISNATTNVGSA